MKKVAFIFLLSSQFLIGQDGAIRVFVTNSQSLDVSGAEILGARPKATEIVDNFFKRESCKPFKITMNKSKADYVVIIDREGRDARKDRFRVSVIDLKANPRC